MVVSAFKVQWDKNISVDDNELDEQHVRLFEFTNNLLLKYHEKNDYEVVLVALNSLVDFSVYHFEYEEYILKERGYPKLESHMKLHDDFRKKIADFRMSLDSGNENVMDRVIIYLIDWIKNHTHVEDLDYKNYMQN